MTSATFTVATTEALVRLLRQGQERATALGRPVVVSLASPLSGDLSPLSVFATARRAGAYRMFWGRPKQDFWLAAAGNSVMLSADGNGCIADVEARRRCLMEDAIVQSPHRPGVGPIFLGGFRFDPRVPRDPMWASFPDALLVLPRILFAWSEGSAWLTINALASPGDDAVAQAKSLSGEIQALTAGTESPLRPPRVVHISETSPEVWGRWVRRGLDAIETGPVSKVVLARKKSLRAEGHFSSDGALRQLVHAYPECTVFCIDSGGASFLGATPEPLARVDDGKLGLTCLAGSAARGSDPAEDHRLQDELLASPKERQEHEAVRAMLASNVKGLCTELRWDETPGVARLRNVQHLLTSFAGALRPGVGVLDVVHRLHPTPAVAGVPTGGALKLIAELEGDRGWYAAPVGWMDHSGGGEFAVAIRSALLLGDQAVLYAGAGIVAGSDPDREFQETELKFRPLLDALTGE